MDRAFLDPIDKRISELDRESRIRCWLELSSRVDFDNSIVIDNFPSS
jgi:hypothetical protein